MESSKTYTQEEVDTAILRIKKDCALWLYSKNKEYGMDVCEEFVSWMNNDMPKLNLIRSKYDRPFLKSEGIHSFSKAFPTSSKFTTNYMIEGSLATFMKTNLATPPEVVKTIVQYCNSKNLKKDHTLTLDDTLKEIMNTSAPNMNIFDIMKHLKHHFTQKDTTVPEDTFDIWDSDNDDE
jgi:chromatin remodeling complex protein RSC6